jgi:hypothetical protein
MKIIKRFDEFIKRLNSKGILIILPASNSEKEKIVRILGEHPDELIDSFLEFKRDTGIKQFSFILDKSELRGWKKKNQPRIVLNFNRLSGKMEIKTCLKDLAENIEEKPKEVKIQPFEEVKPAVQKEQLPQSLLLKLREGLKIKIFLPSEGIKVLQDSQSLWIDLERDDGEIFSIWQFKEWPQEITIGEKDYKIDPSSFSLIDQNTGKKYPLEKGENGEIIIDLSLLKEVEKFLGHLIK